MLFKKEITVKKNCIKNKKTSEKIRGFCIRIKVLYFLNFEYLFLNLSIRPAVSISLDLPV